MAIGGMNILANIVGQTAAILAVIVVGGCGSQANLIARPIDGYDAIRFRQTVILTDHLINEYQFPAGTTLVADRVMDGEVQIFCGSVPINGSSLAICVGYEGNTLVIGPGAGFKRVMRPVSWGAVERIKV